jgi:hypothetical protein
MTTSELKKKLIIKINALENSQLLEEMSRLVGIEDEGSGIYILSETQKEEVGQAQEQYLKGQFLSNKQANKEVDKWLDE